MVLPPRVLRSLVREAARERGYRYATIIIISSRGVRGSSVPRLRRHNIGAYRTRATFLPRPTCTAAIRNYPTGLPRPDIYGIERSKSNHARPVPSAVRSVSRNVWHIYEIDSRFTKLKLSLFKRELTWLIYLLTLSVYSC